MFVITLVLLVCCGNHVWACGPEIYRVLDFSNEEQEMMAQRQAALARLPADSQMGNQGQGRAPKRTYAPSPQGLVRIFPAPLFGPQVSESARITYEPSKTYSPNYFQALLFAQDIARRYIEQQQAVLAQAYQPPPQPQGPQYEDPRARFRGNPHEADQRMGRIDRYTVAPQGVPETSETMDQRRPARQTTGAKGEERPPQQRLGSRQDPDNEGKRYAHQDVEKQVVKQPAEATGKEEVANEAAQPAKEYEQNSPDNDTPDTWVPHQRPLDKLKGMITIPLAHIDGHYLATISIGHPSQTVRVLFDTGSANLCVMSSDACQHVPCDKNRPFKRDDSTTYTKLGEAIEINFAGNTRVSGITGQDHVTIGIGERKFVIFNQQMIEASEFGGIFDGFDVLFGLDMRAPPVMEGRPISPLYQMTTQFGSAPVFGIYLNKWFPDESKMTFGGGERDPYAVTEFHDHPVEQVDIEGIGKIYNGWNIAVDNWIVEGGKSVTKIPVTATTLARPNSGLSIITGPVDVAHQINEAIFSFADFPFDNQEFTFECLEDMNRVWKGLPDVSIVMSGHKYTLEPHDYIGMRFDKCASLIEPVDQDLIVLGWPFMIKYYTRFDQGKKRIQFAEAKQGPHAVIDVLKKLREEGKALLLQKQNGEAGTGAEKPRRQGTFKTE